MSFIQSQGNFVQKAHHVQDVRGLNKIKETDQYLVKIAL